MTFPLLKKIHFSKPGSPFSRGPILRSNYQNNLFLIRCTTEKGWPDEICCSSDRNKQISWILLRVPNHYTFHRMLLHICHSSWGSINYPTGLRLQLTELNWVLYNRQLLVQIFKLRKRQNSKNTAEILQCRPREAVNAHLPKGVFFLREYLEILLCQLHRW